MEGMCYKKVTKACLMKITNALTNTTKSKRPTDIELPHEIAKSIEELYKIYEIPETGIPIIGEQSNEEENTAAKNAIKSLLINVSSLIIIVYKIWKGRVKSTN